mgnify:FL=1|tara:strand:+ start:16099 stop:16950 length:852 start_codon:yes stop_codon:yes gene_type:complete
MTNTTKITDRKTLVFNRKRALNFEDSYNKIHQIAIKEIKDRLEEINREFKDIAIITGHQKIWGKAFPNAKLIDDTDTLIFGKGQYDLIIHALCLHWANDPVGQLIQCKNMLVEDGLFLATLFGGKTLYELNYSFSLAESEISGGISPRFLPMGEIRDLGNLLLRVGFKLPVADNLTTHIHYKDVYSLMNDLRKMGEVNALLSRQKTFTRSQIIEETSKFYIKNFSENDDKIVATFDLIFLTGWYPSENQQKPLKPGSGKINLGVFLDDLKKQPTDPFEQLEKK